MDKRTLKALNGSIKKWEAIVAGTGIDEAASNCPLCKLFRQVLDRSGCSGCPVMETTGKSGCRGTPYFDVWVNADPGIPLNALSNVEERDEARAAAQAEVDFLRSLLPKE